ncbi:hypothetical protein, partial [Klebsiella pneumoniae]|uniref:hypothetical protein n=1 Tax=Klebsiella pneumoniae TaxID=573 RepID=UPI0038797579
GHGACVEQDDKGRDARKRAYCLKIQPATGSFARNLIYSTKPFPPDTVSTRDSVRFTLQQKQTTSEKRERLPQVYL